MDASAALAPLGVLDSVQPGWRENEEGEKETLCCRQRTIETTAAKMPKVPDWILKGIVLFSRTCPV